MPLGEFELIERYFAPLGRTAPRAGILAGIGDDGAVLRPPAGHDLVCVLDAVVEGRHFLPGCDPRSIAHRALARNLSDLAAMGAQPAWALLGLCMPSANESWLALLAEGWRALADAEGVTLVGGDTTRGPLALTVQLTGFVPEGQALLRSGARVGDLLYVSGTLGEAAAALAIDRGELRAPPASGAAFRRRLEYPQARVALGRALRGIASACIDVSDGLAADASHLARANGCGVLLDLDALPVTPALVEAAGAERATRWALTGGEDYELLFAVPPAAESQLRHEVSGICDIARVGVLERRPGLRLRSAGGTREALPEGHDHFGG